jgi:nucleoside-diphosphate-sugar epimerase
MPHRTFKTPRLLIIGCGDIGLRVARLLRGRWRLMALSSSQHRIPELRDHDVIPIVGNLDVPETLGRLGENWATAVLHLAPPQPSGARDLRTRHLLARLAQQRGIRRLVYGSTTGVYGDTQGDRIAEDHPVSPKTDRAVRRVDAENQVRQFGQDQGVITTILRIPGIYARDRPGGHPSERLARGTPVLHAADDVYTNHIHADDLARAIALALHRGPAQQTIHVCDDTDLKMGDYFDLAADLCALPRPPRISRQQAEQQLSPMQLTFMSESRRLCNNKLKHILGLRLRYPTVREGL